MPSQSRPASTTVKPRADDFNIYFIIRSMLLNSDVDCWCGQTVSHRFNFDSTCFNAVERVATGFNIAVEQNRTDVEAVCSGLKQGRPLLGRYKETATSC